MNLAGWRGWAFAVGLWVVLVAVGLLAAPWLLHALDAYAAWVDQFWR